MEVVADFVVDIVVDIEDDIDLVDQQLDSFDMLKIEYIIKITGFK